MPRRLARPNFSRLTQQRCRRAGVQRSHRALARGRHTRHQTRWARVRGPRHGEHRAPRLQGGRPKGPRSARGRDCCGKMRRHAALPELASLAPAFHRARPAVSAAVFARRISGGAPNVPLVRVPSWHVLPQHFQGSLGKRAQPDLSVCVPTNRGVRARAAPGQVLRAPRVSGCSAWRGAAARAAFAGRPTPAARRRSGLVTPSS